MSPCPDGETDRKICSCHMHSIHPDGTEGRGDQSSPSTQYRSYSNRLPDPALGRAPSMSMHESCKSVLPIVSLTLCSHSSKRDNLSLHLLGQACDNMPSHCKMKLSLPKPSIQAIESALGAATPGPAGLRRIKFYDYSQTYGGSCSPAPNLLCLF